MTEGIAFQVEGCHARNGVTGDPNICAVARALKDASIGATNIRVGKQTIRATFRERGVSVAWPTPEPVRQFIEIFDANPEWAAGLVPFEVVLGVDENGQPDDSGVTIRPIDRGETQMERRRTYAARLRENPVESAERNAYLVERAKLRKERDRNS